MKEREDYEREPQRSKGYEKYIGFLFATTVSEPKFSGLK